MCLPLFAPVFGQRVEILADGYDGGGDGEPFHDDGIAQPPFNRITRFHGQVLDEAGEAQVVGPVDCDTQLARHMRACRRGAFAWLRYLAMPKSHLRQAKIVVTAVHLEAAFLLTLSEIPGRHTILHSHAPSRGQHVATKADVFQSHAVRSRIHSFSRAAARVKKGFAVQPDHRVCAVQLEPLLVLLGHFTRGLMAVAPAGVGVGVRNILSMTLGEVAQCMPGPHHESPLLGNRLEPAPEHHKSGVRLHHCNELNCLVVTWSDSRACDSPHEQSHQKMHAWVLERQLSLVWG